MLRTPLCDLLGISVPIVLAPFGPWDEVDLAAAVCESGALGSLGTAIRSADELREQWARLRSLTGQPFAVNHTGRPFNEEAFAATLDAQPAAISFHMGVPADLIVRAHDRGIAVMVNRPFRQQALIRRFEGVALPGWADEIGASSWAQFILKFILSHPAVTVVIPATTRIDHVRENIAAAAGPLPDEAMRRRMVAHIREF